MTKPSVSMEEGTESRKIYMPSVQMKTELRKKNGISADISVFPEPLGLIMQCFRI